VFFSCGKLRTYNRILRILKALKLGKFIYMTALGDANSLRDPNLGQFAGSPLSDPSLTAVHYPCHAFNVVYDNAVCLDIHRRITR